MTVTINGNGSIAGLADPILIASLSADQNVSDATFTAVAFNLEAVDTHSAHLNGVFTVPVAGFYQVNWVVIGATLAPAQVLNTTSQLMRNAQVMRRGAQSSVSLGKEYDTFASSGSALVSCAVGDTLSIQAYVDVSAGTPRFVSPTTAWDIKLVQRT